MECCICKDTIDEKTSHVRTTCNHTFHFGCLATWTTKTPSCPLCRCDFRETDNIQPVAENIRRELPIDLPANQRRLIDMIESGMDWNTAVNFLRDSSFGRTRLWTPRIRQTLQTKYDNTQHHSYDRDVAFIMEYAEVSERTAESYLAFFRDPVETVMCFVTSDKLPIPRFRARNRGEAEPYQSRVPYIEGNEHYDGYVSM